MENNCYAKSDQLSKMLFISAILQSPAWNDAVGHGSHPRFGQINFADLFPTVQVCDATMLPLLQMPGTKKAPRNGVL